MLLTFASGSFPQEYIPTVFDEWVGSLTVDGNMVSFGLWDTAGQSECVFFPLCACATCAADRCGVSAGVAQV